MDRHEQLINLAASFEKDFHKFYEQGVKAAGIRVRKDMQALRKLCKEIREEVSAKTKEI